MFELMESQQENAIIKVVGVGGGVEPAEPGVVFVVTGVEGVLLFVVAVAPLVVVVFTVLESVDTIVGVLLNEDVFKAKLGCRFCPEPAVIFWFCENAYIANPPKTAIE